MSNIHYKYPHSSIFGEECPVCKHKSWAIFECECGIVFCRNCHSECVKLEDDDESVLATCSSCGKSTIFI